MIVKIANTQPFDFDTSKMTVIKLTDSQHNTLLKQLYIDNTDGTILAYGNRQLVELFEKLSCVFYATTLYLYDSHPDFAALVLKAGE